MKKAGLILFIIILNIFAISAINLDVSNRPISNTYIIDLNKPAVFDLTIKNLEDNDDDFQIYSLVGVDIKHEPLRISAGETKKVTVELIPQGSLKNKRDAPLTFEYKIKNSKNEIQKETLSINILDLSSIFSVAPERIHPNSEKIAITIKNNIIYNFSFINWKVSSIFFDHEEIFYLDQREEKLISIVLDKNKLKSINAGTYLMNSQFIVDGKTANIESQIKFLEQEGIEVSENDEGLIIRRTEIIKKNSGNIKRIVQITAEKNFISYLFTTTNIAPTKTERKGFSKIYSWEKELIPTEEIKIVIKTNWLLPIIIIFFIIAIIFSIRRSVYADIELRKRVSFVKTKGGEFALKVTLSLIAKKFVERIVIIDKLPNIVELYKKFGLIHPDKIDLNNKRLEWNLQSLNKGESRIFSYIIYSKIGVVGRFELPEAKAIYEQDGKIKEVSSNRSFYVNEPKRI